MKSVESVKQDEGLGCTVVTVRVSGFQNFGQRLAELEQQAFDADETDDPEMTAAMNSEIAPTTPEEREQAKAELNRMLKEMDGPGAEMMAKMANSLGMPLDTFKQVAEVLNDALEDDDEECGSYDLEKLSVELAPGLAWNERTEQRLDEFIADWPKVRPALLKETFRTYQEVYPDAAEFYEGDPGREFLLPEPSNPEAVENLFCIETVILNKDGSIGLAGPCTWDEDHGFGARIKDGEVILVGQITDAYA